MSLYLDTSALVKLLVAEPGTDEVQRAYNDADGVRCTAIAHVEATAALARMRKGGRLTPVQLRRGLDDLEKLWRGLYVHAVSDALLAEAAESARTHSLRAYDAVHLAGALSFAAGEELEFACWDKELRDAAHHHGLALFPRQLWDPMSREEALTMEGSGWAGDLDEIRAPDEISGP